MNETIFSNIDQDVNPRDNFYKYATGKWLKNNPQPEGYPVWNVFTKLRNDNLEIIRKIITEADMNNPMSVKINNYYNLIMDMKTRNSLGVTPVMPLINEVMNIENREDLIAHSNNNNIELFFNTHIASDETTYEIEITQSGLGLFNKDYYLVASPENTKVVNAYKKYIHDLFIAFGFDEDFATDAVKTIYKYESLMAPDSYSVEDTQDPVKNHNVMSVDELSVITNFDWNKYLCDLGYTETKKVIVNNPEFCKFACNFLNTLQLRHLKYFYVCNIMNMSSTLVSEKVDDIEFAFNKVMSGSTSKLPLWKRAISRVSGTMPDPIGEIYVEKYFSYNDKFRVTLMINKIKKAFAEILSEQHWMSESTRKHALEKLELMNFKIGYPDKWDDYSQLPVDPSLPLFTNYMNIRKFMFEKDKKEFYNKPIDRSRWFMAAQEVNAYYDPINNEMCFPAGILQYPFFSSTRTDAENFGGIGVVIAHELTHAFDNHGRMYDKNGILNDWWTTEDSAKFVELTQNTINRFNTFEVLPGLCCNGTLTLGENIADFGGLKTAYRACSYSNKNTEEWAQTFFIAYANSWSEVITDEALRTKVNNNEHSPNIARVNGTLPMFDEFYKAFDINESSAMFVEKEKRSKVW